MKPGLISQASLVAGGRAAGLAPSGSKSFKPAWKQSCLSPSLSLSLSLGLASGIRADRVWNSLPAKETSAWEQPGEKASLPLLPDPSLRGASRPTGLGVAPGLSRPALSVPKGAGAGKPSVHTSDSQYLTLSSPPLREAFPLLLHESQDTVKHTPKCRGHEG